VILLDTCVISESLKPEPEACLLAWLETLDEDRVFLPSIALGELQKGVELLPEGRKRTALRLWLEQLRQRFTGKILPFDEDAALAWGSLCARLSKEGKPGPAVDGMIAAIALRHRAILATRNEVDFASMGVEIINPWNP
jgi:predicted nucleic acid-binding protein